MIILRPTVFCSPLRTSSMQPSFIQLFEIGRRPSGWLHADGDDKEYRAKCGERLTHSSDRCGEWRGCRESLARCLPLADGCFSLILRLRLSAAVIVSNYPRVPLDKYQLFKVMHQTTLNHDRPEERQLAKRRSRIAATAAAGVVESRRASEAIIVWTCYAKQYSTANCKVTYRIDGLGTQRSIASIVELYIKELLLL